MEKPYLRVVASNDNPTQNLETSLTARQVLRIRQALYDASEPIETARPKRKALGGVS